MTEASLLSVVVTVAWSVLVGLVCLAFFAVGFLAGRNAELSGRARGRATTLFDRWLAKLRQLRVRQDLAEALRPSQRHPRSGKTASQLTSDSSDTPRTNGEAQAFSALRSAARRAERVFRRNRHHARGLRSFRRRRAANR